MKYTKLFLVLLLLVAFTLPPHGVYAESGSGSDGTESIDDTTDSDDETDDVEEAEVEDVDENESDEDDSEIRHRLEVKDGRLREEIRVGDMRYKREFKDSMMREELKMKGPGNGQIFKQELMAPQTPFKFVDPLHLIIGAMFHKAEIQPKEFVAQCDDPEAMVDAIVAKMKEKDVWEDRSACTKLEEESSRCEERAAKCDERIAKGPGVLGDLNCEDLTEDKLAEKCVADVTARAEAEGKEVSAEAEAKCEAQATARFEGLKTACDQRVKQAETCQEVAKKHCEVFQEAAEKCASITEEDLKEALMKDAERMCKFAHYETGKERIELRGHDVSALVKELQALRAKAGLSEQVVLDENADSVVEVAETVDEVENRGIGRKLKWFVGAAAKAEKEDAGLLKGQVKRLETTIASLESVAASLTDETAKTAIEAQIEVLKAQQEDIQELAAKKQKRARGMFSFLFGGDDSEESTEVESEAETEIEIEEETQ